MKQTTIMGFGITKFKDAYGEECSLQESSAVKPHVWLGIDKVEPKILASKTEHGGTGWVKYYIPSGVMLNSRMHLNIEQVETLIVWLSDWLEEYKEATND